VEDIHHTEGICETVSIMANERLVPSTVSNYKSRLKAFRRMVEDRQLPAWYRAWAKQRADALQKRLAREN
jgi:hypothetical protein